MALRDAIDSGPVDRASSVASVTSSRMSWSVSPSLRRRARTSRPRSTRHRGGSAANTAAAVAHLGGRARFVGQVGADEIGDRLLRDLRRSGSTASDRDGGSRAPSWSSSIPRANERCSAIARAAADLAVCDEQWLDGAAVLHVPYYSLARSAAPSVVRTLIDAARRRGILVSLDPRVRDARRPALRSTSCGR